MSSRNTRPLWRGALGLLLALSFLAGQLVSSRPALAAAAPIAGGYAQSFDSLGASGANWTDDLTIVSWYSNRTTYLAGTGTLNTGALYSFGSSSDRALGSVGSTATGTIFYGVRLVNSGTSPITQLNVSYTGEQWRNGGNTTAQKLDFQYQIGAASLITGAWVDLDGLDFSGPVATASTGALDGNAAANRLARAAAINASVAPGQEIWLRWQDINDAGNDHGLAIDDLSVNAGTIADTAPAVTGTVPANNATGVSVATNITISFSEPVNVAAGQVTVECPAGTVVATNAAASNVTSLVIDPAGNLPAGASCTVTVPAGAVSDVDGNDPPDTLTATFSTGFSTELAPCQQAATKISAIQGPGASAAITGPVTIQGVVTAIFPGLQGINVQEELADADGSLATSEGIGVFLGANFATLTSGLQVGDVARVSGTAGERSTSGVLQTQLSGAVAITDCGPASAPITPVDVMFPLGSLSDLEPYESMLVRFPQELFIGEYFNYDRFGEIVLGYAGDLSAELGDSGRFYTPTSITTPGAAANTLAAKYALRRITLDDAVSASPPSSIPHPNGLPFGPSNRFRGGDTVTGQVGVIEHTFGLYRIQPTAYGAYSPLNPREATPEVGGTLKVASYNVLNYFVTVDNGSGAANDICGPSKNQDCRGADSASEFARQRSKLIAALSTIDADIYGLIELENTTDVEPLADIVAGLNAASAPGTFAYIDTGTIGGDAIKVGIIYKPASVTPIGAYETIDENDDPRFNTSRSRPALAQTFAQPNGARFTVVVNHLKSKGSACGAGDPDTGDGQGNCNKTREAAAQALVDWLATDPTGSGDADFLVMGDLNAYAKEDPIIAIKAGADDTAGSADDFINLIESRLGTFAYSYVFDGQAGYLDHALASGSLESQVSGVADWHLNSDEPDILDYNDATQDAGENPNGSERKGFDVTDPASPFRTADHDPVLIGLSLNAPPTLSAGGPYSVAEGSAVTLAAVGSDPDGDALSYAWDLDNNGSFETIGQSVSFSAELLDGPTSVTVRVQVSDGRHTATATATVNVTNVAPSVTASFGPSAGCGVASTLTVSFSDPGSADTHSAVINWGDGSAPTTLTGVSSPFTASHTYASAGTYTASVTVTDDDGSSGTASPKTAVNYTVVGGGVLQPINQDGSSVFKYGSTIPVKLRLAACDGSFPANLAPTIKLTQISGSAPGGEINEPLSTSAGDTTGVLRYDATNQQYIYNLATKPLPDPTATYEITITVPATGQTVKVRFGLR